MDRGASHQHLRHVVEVLVDRLKDVHALQTRVSRVYHDRLQAVVEEVMSEVSTPGATIVIDRLEVETEPVAVDHLEAEWPEKLRRALRRALADVRPPAAGIQAPAAGPDQHRVDPAFDALVFLLDWGVEAWWAPAARPPFLDEQLAAVLDRRPTDIAAAVRHRIYRAPVRQRLAVQLSDPTLAHLVRVLAPRESTFLLAAWSSLARAIGGDGARLRLALAERLLTAAASPDGGRANRASFAVELLSAAAQVTGRDAASLRQRWASAVDGNAPDVPEEQRSTILRAFDEATPAATPQAEMEDWCEYVWRFGSQPAGRPGRPALETGARGIDAESLRMRLRRAPRDGGAAARMSRPGARASTQELIEALEPTESREVASILSAFSAAHRRVAADEPDADFETGLLDATLVHLVRERGASFSSRALAASILRQLRVRDPRSIPGKLEEVIGDAASGSTAPSWPAPAGPIRDRSASEVDTEVLASKGDAPGAARGESFDGASELESPIVSWLSSSQRVPHALPDASTVAAARRLFERDPQRLMTLIRERAPSAGAGTDMLSSLLGGGLLPAALAHFSRAMDAAVRSTARPPAEPAAGPGHEPRATRTEGRHAPPPDEVHALEAVLERWLNDRRGPGRRRRARSSTVDAARRLFERDPVRLTALIRRQAASAGDEIAILSSLFDGELLAAARAHLSARSDAAAARPARPTGEAATAPDRFTQAERASGAGSTGDVRGLEIAVEHWLAPKSVRERRGRARLSGPVAARRLFERAPDRLIALIRGAEDSARAAAVMARGLPDDVLEAIAATLQPALAALLIEIAGRVRADAVLASSRTAVWESAIALLLAPDVTTRRLDEILDELLVRLSSRRSRSASVLVARAGTWIDAANEDEASATRARVVADAWSIAARRFHRQRRSRTRPPHDALDLGASHGLRELALDVATVKLIASAPGVAPSERAGLIGVVHVFQELDRIAPPAVAWPAAWRSLVRRWTRLHLAARRGGTTIEDLVALLAARASDEVDAVPDRWREWLEAAITRGSADRASSARMIDAVRAAFAPSPALPMTSGPSIADRVLLGIDALLRHGALPVRLGVGRRERPAALLRWAVRHEPARLARIVRNTRAPAIAARLLAQWSTGTRVPDRLASILAPAHESARRAAAALRALSMGGDGAAWSRVVLEQLFRVALEQGSSLDDLAAGVVEQWAAERGESELAVSATLHEAAAGASDRPSHEDLVEAVARLRRRLEIAPPAPGVVPPARPAEPPSRPDTVRGTLPIANAGLVLLWGFLPHYFRRTRVLGEDGQFVDGAARERAVHLVQLLADGAGETPEPELALNKILCGMPIEAPVPRGIVATDEERAHARALLAAAIHHWTRIRDRVSIAGFQESFLRRRGWLARENAAWRVTVEPRGIDVLLDTLPWSISIVKTTWMPQPLMVSWR